MGSHCSHGLRSVAGNSGIKEGLVLQGETSGEKVIRQSIQQSSVIRDKLFAHISCLFTFSNNNPLFSSKKREGGTDPKRHSCTIGIISG